MIETIQNIGWSIVFSVVGGLLGMVLVLIASVVVPRLIDRLTPNIDEQKEIVRGNGAALPVFFRRVRFRKDRSGVALPMHRHRSSCERQRQPERHRKRKYNLTARRQNVRHPLR